MDNYTGYILNWRINKFFLQHYLILVPNIFLYFIVLYFYLCWNVFWLVFWHLVPFWIWFVDWQGNLFGPLKSWVEMYATLMKIKQKLFNFQLLVLHQPSTVTRARECSVWPTFRLFNAQQESWCVKTPPMVSPYHKFYKCKHNLKNHISYRQLLLQT